MTFLLCVTRYLTFRKQLEGGRVYLSSHFKGDSPSWRQKGDSRCVSGVRKEKELDAGAHLAFSFSVHLRIQVKNAAAQRYVSMVTLKPIKLTFTVTMEVGLSD